MWEGNKQAADTAHFAFEQSFLLTFKVAFENFFHDLTFCDSFLCFLIIMSNKNNKNEL